MNFNNQIFLENCSVEFPRYSSHDFNLKRRALQLFSSDTDTKKSITGLQHVSLVVHHGERVALVGRNGSGKTTLLRILAGVIHPTSGSVNVQARHLAMIGAIGPQIDPDLSGIENIRDLGLLYRMSKGWMKQNLEKIVDLSGLGKRIDDPTRTYSTGMIMRLRTSFAICLRPDVLLVDEGIGGADLDFNNKIQSEVDQLVQNGSIAVFASHNNQLLNKYCSRSILLDCGRVIFDGQLDECLSIYNEIANIYQSADVE
jgi:ABC-2 type transport system ATP-binding protein